MYGRTYDAQRYSPLKQINKKNVAKPDPVVDLPDRRARRLRVHAAGHRRHHVHHDAVEPRLRDRLQDRLAALALPEVAAGEPGPVLRRRQPRLRRLRRSALHDHARRPPGLPRPQHRRGDLGHRDHRHRRRRQGGQGHLQDGLQRHGRPAGRQGQGDHGHQRGRVRHPRLHRRLRRQDRQAAVALLHRAQPPTTRRSTPRRR